MSSLTEQERIGLEEVFLSISTASKPSGKLAAFKQKIKHFKGKNALFGTLGKPTAVMFVALKRIKFSNFQHLFPKRKKKKKNLS